MRSSWIILILLLLATSCRNQGEKVVLAFRYIPGETYEYQMIDEVQYDTRKYSGERLSVSRLQHQDTVIRVKSKDGAEDVFNLRIGFSVTSDTILYPDDYKLEKKQHPVGKPGRVDEFNVVMRGDGKILSVVGENQSATEHYESAYKTRQPVFPKKAIGPGFGWSHKIYLKFPNSDPVPVVIAYKFDRFEMVDMYRCAVIAYRSTFEKKRDLTETKYNDSNYKQLDAHYTTENHGELFFAIKEGIVARKTATIRLATKLNIIEADNTDNYFERNTIDKETVFLVAIRKSDDSSSVR